MADDAKDDPIAACDIGEAGDGPGAAAQFAKRTLDHVGGAHFLPMTLGNGEKIQQAIQQATALGRRVSQASFH
jgi:hypothetical protein